MKSDRSYLFTMSTFEPSHFSFNFRNRNFLLFKSALIPYGELKSYNLRRNLAKLEPTLAIREGLFNEIGQYEY